MSDWIKVHRKMREWEWYKDGPCVQVFLHCLLSANYKNGKWQGHEIPAGSFPTGLHAIAGFTGLSVQQVRTALKKLEKSGNLTIKSTSKFSIISIVKWKSYQADNKPSTNNQQTSNKPSTTLKEGKKGRREEYIRPSDVSEITWQDFLKLRAAKKAPVTETALKKIRTEAGKINWNLERALQECCARGWQGFESEWVKKPREGPKRGYQGM